MILLSETTLYFITKDNRVRSLNHSTKDLMYKYVQENIYQVYLDDEWYDIDRETWDYISEWTAWH